MGILGGGTGDSPLFPASLLFPLSSVVLHVTTEAFAMKWCVVTMNGVCTSVNVCDCVIL